MITPIEIVRSLMHDLDVGAKAYADACVAYAQAGDDPAEARRTIDAMTRAHDMLMSRAKSVAEIL